MASSRAYALLLEELAASRTAIIAALDQHRSFTDEQCVTLVTAFHTVRGGAGFFGLKEIADIAHQIETMLSNPRDVAREELERLAGRFSDTLAALEDPSKKCTQRGDDA